MVLDIIDLLIGVNSKNEGTDKEVIYYIANLIIYSFSSHDDDD